jgi:hypothetical protein
MSPAEVRNVLRELQSAFTSTAAPFSTVEISAAPRDQSIQPVAEEADEEEARGGEWLYLVGAAVALLLIIGFLYAALAGPLKQTPGPTATPTPGAATPSAASTTP